MSDVFAKLGWDVSDNCPLVSPFITGVTTTSRRLQE